MKKVIRLTESDLVRIVKRVINEQATVPAEVSLNYEDTLRNNSTFKAGYQMWDTIATFVKAGDNQMTLSQIIFESEDNENQESITVPLKSPFTFTAPLDYAQSDANNRMFDNGIKLNLTPEILKRLNNVKFGGKAQTLDITPQSFDGFGYSVYSALEFYANHNNMFTGPENTSPKAQTLFVNMEGKKGSFKFA
jgi:hypothetical protein